LATTGDREAYYWSTQSGAEIDLLLTVGGKRIGIEVKYTDAPRATRSLRVAIEDLKLARAYVVHPGTARYELGDGAEAIGLSELLRVLDERARHRKRRRPGHGATP
jgi:predicted AAA+ superfamily ATPase